MERVEADQIYVIIHRNKFKQFIFEVRTITTFFKCDANAIN